MTKDFSAVTVKGHVNITDDLGTVYLDKDNAVHPQNMARVIARALSNESNYNISRIAFGNGGTITNAAFAITYNTPNDGQPPDTHTWDSRLYHETYSEIVDEGNPTLNPDLGTDPGSAGQGNTRPGGGADPSGDPASIPHVSGPGVRSNELGLTSEIVITAVLNPGEPTGQFSSDNQAPTEDTESAFTFDEIGLYTPGSPADDSSGSQDVDVSNRSSEDDTGLTTGADYDFIITIDGGTSQSIVLQNTSGGGSGPAGEILYGDLCEAINANGSGDWDVTVNGTLQSAGTPAVAGMVVSITNNTLVFPSIPDGAQTFGHLRFTSDTVGDTSSIALTAGATNDLFDALNPPTGGTILAANDGMNAGVQNDPVTPNTERERLLTHIIFSPVLKSANRTLTVTYTLTVSVARTQY